MSSYQGVGEQLATSLSIPTSHIICQGESFAGNVHFP